MNAKLSRFMIIGATAFAWGAMSAPGSSADPAWEIMLPAGQVCAFPLVVAGSGEGAQVYREFTKDGILRTLSAGTGYELTFRNGDTGVSFSTPSNGAVNRAQYRPDGSSTQVLTGHNAVLLFPTDVGGPSATLYTGRVVVTIDPAGTWTVAQASGTNLDICAQLADGGEG